MRSQTNSHVMIYAMFDTQRKKWTILSNFKIYTSRDIDNYYASSDAYRGETPFYESE